MTRLSKQLWHERRLQFKDKRITKLPKNPRKDKCEWCNKSISDEYINSRGITTKIKRLHTHHIQYHEDDPLKDTITLCPSCHLKESQRLKKLNEKPRRCGICHSTKTKRQSKRYPSGKVIYYDRWHRNPETKKEWVCFSCYNKIQWKLKKEVYM